MGDPAPEGNLLLQLIVLFVLIFINAFFAMSEIAIITLNDNKISRMADEGHKKYQLIQKLTSNSSRFLSTIQVGVTLAGFLTSASAAQSLATRLSVWFYQLFPKMAHGLVDTIAIILITIVMSYFSLVLGELVPKRIAMNSPEKVSFAVIGALLFISAVLKPAVKFLSLSTNAVLRLIGIDPNASDDVVTEEEIRMMVDVGEEKGVIEESQKEMINNIFEFDDINAGDIMTHRTDMAALDVEDSLQEAVGISIAEGYSRLPVYEEDLDNIIGIIYVKDLLPFVGNILPVDKSIRDIMRPAYFVPETMRCRDLFTQMTEKRVQMAIVVDEYGGTAGMITMEDLLESIVGNIQDEYDDEEEEISRIDENNFTIDGVTDIDEVSEIIGVDLPGGDYDTLGGFLIDQLGFLPSASECPEVNYGGIHFMIQSVEDRRIGKVRVIIAPEDESKEEKMKEE